MRQILIALGVAMAAAGHAVADAGDGMMNGTDMGATDLALAGSVCCCSGGW